MQSLPFFLERHTACRVLYVEKNTIALTLVFTACSQQEEAGVAETVPADGQKIRLHAIINGGTRIDVPSDNKTDWAKDDIIFTGNNMGKIKMYSCEKGFEYKKNHKDINNE